MDVISVDNTSLYCSALKNTREFTQGRNPMDVISVRNSSLGYPTLKDTRKLTLERCSNNSDQLCGKIADICSLCHYSVTQVVIFSSLRTHVALPLILSAFICCHSPAKHRFYIVVPIYCLL